MKNKKIKYPPKIKNKYKKKRNYNQMKLESGIKENLKAQNKKIFKAYNNSIQVEPLIKDQSNEIKNINFIYEDNFEYTNFHTINQAPNKEEIPYLKELPY